jgi:carbamoyl-phosphate synthase small subunit
LVPPLLAGYARATLALSDGSRFTGYAAGGKTDASGEVVFNTSMFGYQEMLTDPSYRGQILVLTAPHIGNVGVNQDDDESARVWAEGLIVPDLSLLPSNWRAAGGLPDRLEALGVPVGWGFDTRALVLHLREKGAARRAGDRTRAREAGTRQVAFACPRHRRLRLHPGGGSHRDREVAPGSLARDRRGNADTASRIPDP